MPLPAGTPKEVKFQFPNLPAGLHQAEVSLEAPDTVAFDDVRFVIPRRRTGILTITDGPTGRVQGIAPQQGRVRVVLKKPDG